METGLNSIALCSSHFILVRRQRATLSRSQCIYNYCTCIVYRQHCTFNVLRHQSLQGDKTQFTCSTHSFNCVAKVAMLFTVSGAAANFALLLYTCLDVTIDKELSRSLTIMSCWWSLFLLDEAVTLNQTNTDDILYYGLRHYSQRVKPRLHQRNMLPLRATSNMLRWCKRGFRLLCFIHIFRIGFNCYFIHRF